MMRDSMEKQSIDETFDKFWFAFPTDLCRGKRGGKANALKAWKKINPDQAEFYRIMENMKAQIRHDRKDSDSYRWPFVSSYLNQARYDDVIESEVDRKERVDLKTCCIEDCSNDVHGPAFKHCAEHVKNAHSDLLTKAFKATGLQYSSPDFVKDCQAMCRQGLNKMVNKAETIK